MVCEERGERGKGDEGKGSRKQKTLEQQRRGWEEHEKGKME